jgi:hypothetical protein
MEITLANQRTKVFVSLPQPEQAVSACSSTWPQCWQTPWAGSWLSLIFTAVSGPTKAGLAGSRLVTIMGTP